MEVYGMINPIKNPVLTGVIISLIFAVILGVATIAAVKGVRHVVDRVEVISGYGLDGVK